MAETVPRIVGSAYQVPDRIRHNDDPVFDWLRANHPQGEDLFKGYDERRVLGPGEDLMTLMVPASFKAMAAAGVGVADIDMLLGYASVSPFDTPNQLCQLHHMLALDARALVVPIHNEFSNFTVALLMAHSLIASGVARTILVAAGCNWSRYVDYHTPQSISAADGAAAVVVQLSDDRHKFRYVDQHSIVDTTYYGAMFMQADRYPMDPPYLGREALFSAPYFHIDPAGFSGFDHFGEHVTPTAVTELLHRHELKGADVTLISHQASSTLLDAWNALIQPAQYVQTLARFANMTLANLPVNLAWCTENQPISRDHLVLLGIGGEMHAHAQLWRRGR
jgi:3-oxoacyl-[acyl-carrier-protein] synthase III